MHVGRLGSGSPSTPPQGVSGDCGSSLCRYRRARQSKPARSSARPRRTLGTSFRHSYVFLPANAPGCLGGPASARPRLILTLAGSTPSSKRNIEKGRGRLPRPFSHGGAPPPEEYLSLLLFINTRSAAFHETVSVRIQDLRSANVLVLYLPDVAHQAGTRQSGWVVARHRIRCGGCGSLVNAMDG